MDLQGLGFPVGAPRTFFFTHDVDDNDDDDDDDVLGNGNWSGWSGSFNPKFR